MCVCVCVGARVHARLHYKINECNVQITVINFQIIAQAIAIVHTVECATLFIITYQTSQTENPTKLKILTTTRRTCIKVSRVIVSCRFVSEVASKCKA